MARATSGLCGKARAVVCLGFSACLASCGPVPSRGSPPPPTAYQGSTTPPPALDRNGNPNYDASGQYIGGHGVGTLVDSPERVNASPPTPSDMVREEQRKIDRSVCQGLNVGNPSACD
jgi:hypothetical protein